MGKLTRAEEERYDELADSDEQVPDSAVGTRRNREVAKVYSVRLTPALVASVEAEAERSDVSTSTLIRGFIERGLAERQERVTPAVMIEGIKDDLERLSMVFLAYNRNNELIVDPDSVEQGNAKRAMATREKARQATGGRGKP